MDPLKPFTGTELELALKVSELVKKIKSLTVDMPPIEAACLEMAGLIDLLHQDSRTPIGIELMQAWARIEISLDNVKNEKAKEIIIEAIDNLEQTSKMDLEKNLGWEAIWETKSFKLNIDGHIPAFREWAVEFARNNKNMDPFQKLDSTAEERATKESPLDDKGNSTPKANAAMTACIQGNMELFQKIQSHFVIF